MRLSPTLTAAEAASITEAVSGLTKAEAAAGAVRVKVDV
jgi:hypothetical protein